MQKETVFVMAHMRRWKKESAFFKKAKKLFVIDVLHTCALSDGARVGVLVYRFVPKDLVAFDVCFCQLVKLDIGQILLCVVKLY
ncbi:hypothetical protein HN51_008854 [Arachis hypogaea]